jgi:hypothetical protein
MHRLTKGELVLSNTGGVGKLTGRVPGKQSCNILALEIVSKAGYRAFFGCLVANRNHETLYF